MFAKFTLFLLIDLNELIDFNELIDLIDFNELLLNCCLMFDAVEGGILAPVNTPIIPS